MSVVSPLVLLMLGALIHGSSALRCYSCASDYGGACDDPLDTSTTTKGDCGDGTVYACYKEKGKYVPRDSISDLPVVRSCRASLENKCTKYNNETRPGDENHYFTGEVCSCTTDLCNSAPQTLIGHLTVSFIGMVSLLALTIARLLSQ